MAPPLTARNVRQLNDINPVTKSAKLGQFLSDMDGRTIQLPLSAVDAAAGVARYQNTGLTPLIVGDVYVYVATVAGQACTLAVGTAATAILANNLIDALDVRTAAGVFDNVTDKGVAGKSRGLLPVGGYLTVSVASGQSAGLTGKLLVNAVPA